MKSQPYWTNINPVSNHCMPGWGGGQLLLWSPEVLAHVFQYFICPLCLIPDYQVLRSFAGLSVLPLPEALSEFCQKLQGNLGKPPHGITTAASLAGWGLPSLNPSSYTRGEGVMQHPSIQENFPHLTTWSRETTLLSKPYKGNKHLNRHSPSIFVNLHVSFLFDMYLSVPVQVLYRMNT